MEERRVDCIRKANRDDQYSSITHLGGIKHGQRWVETAAMVIFDIDYDRRSYYVEEDGKKVKIVVIRKEDKPYLRTEKDNEESNNLLDLPECPQKK